MTAQVCDDIAAPYAKHHRRRQREQRQRAERRPDGDRAIPERDRRKRHDDNDGEREIGLLEIHQHHEDGAKT